jgi:hypothetical protein
MMRACLEQSIDVIDFRKPLNTVEIEILFLARSPLSHEFVVSKLLREST